MGRQLAAGICLLLALAISGCGEDEQTDEEQIREVTETYLVALGEKDYAEACEQLAASARRDLVDYVLAQLPELGTTECESLFKQIIDLTDESDLAVLREAEVENVNLNGDRATVIVKGASENAELAKVEGDWKISELQFPGVDGAGAPPAEAPAEPEPDTGDADALRENLTAAGYKVRRTGRGSGEPKPVAAFDTRLGDGGELTIYVYPTVAEAAQSRREFAKVENELPNQIEVAVHETAVYVGTIEEPATLSQAEFEKAVAAATG